MIPKECKRLAEVDFPIAVVSRHSAREKTIRHGHPSTLHLWWARRPLAACRSMLLSLLLPDPEDERCPADFKAEAKQLLPRLQGKTPKTDADLRAALLKFVGDVADWDNANNRTYLEISRGLVKAAHGEVPPLVADPFAGGGAIPLEALRLGCDAFASDLNPVACLINKVMLEDIPRHGPELAEELRKMGAAIKVAAERELNEFYPPDKDGGQPIAYLWARTVRCESPNCGAEIPLVRSFWLCKKDKRRKALRATALKNGKGPRVEFEIFEPKSDKDISVGTVSRAKATCLCCQAVLPSERVRAQLHSQRGGADVVFDEKGNRTGGALLLAVVTLRSQTTGRHYRLPTATDYNAVRQTQAKLKLISAELRPDGMSAIPDEPTPKGGGSGAGRAFSLQKYGMMNWGDLFTARQKLAIHSLSRHTAPHLETTSAIAFAVGKLLDLSNAICGWIPQVECPSAVFKQGRVKSAWDFVEGVPTRDSSGSYEVCRDNLIAGVLSAHVHGHVGQVQSAPAQRSPLTADSCAVWFTDPPYYDAIPYAHLSDFFFCWLKRIVPPATFDRLGVKLEAGQTPKLLEAVRDEVTNDQNGRPKNQAFYEGAMAESFREGANVVQEDGIGCVVFAHKSTEGWEALLTGMIQGGWTITGSWPIATEMAHRLRARDSAALATSIHLICRPRPEDAPVGDWTHVIRELPKRVSEWIERLQSEGVRGADLVFACIGPALEIYSRYSKVVDAEDREIPLGGDPEATTPHERGYLAAVWETVGRAALEQVLGRAGSSAGALEEDARLTALFLWTLQATEAEGDESETGEEDIDEEESDEDDEGGSGKKKGGFSLVYDVARRFAQPLGIHLEVWENRVIETKKGTVRLLPVSERAEQLFGKDGADAVADRLDAGPKKATDQQMTLFDILEEVGEDPTPKKGRNKKGPGVADDALKSKREATTLDRVHAAMLLQSSGRTNALRTLLKDEVARGGEFLRLANALSALYPQGCEEKRLLDAMLLAMPR